MSVDSFSSTHQADLFVAAVEHQYYAGKIRRPQIEWTDDHKLKSLAVVGKVVAWTTGYGLARFPDVVMHALTPIPHAGTTGASALVGSILAQFFERDEVVRVIDKALPAVNFFVRPVRSGWCRPEMLQVRSQFRRRVMRPSAGLLAKTRFFFGSNPGHLVGGAAIGLLFPVVIFPLIGLAAGVVLPLVGLGAAGAAIAGVAVSGIGAWAYMVPSSAVFRWLFPYADQRWHLHDLFEGGLKKFLRGLGKTFEVLGSGRRRALNSVRVMLGREPRDYENGHKTRLQKMIELRVGEHEPSFPEPPKGFYRRLTMSQAMQLAKEVMNNKAHMLPGTTHEAEETDKKSVDVANVAVKEMVDLARRLQQFIVYPRDSHPDTEGSWGSRLWKRTKFDVYEFLHVTKKVDHGIDLPEGLQILGESEGAWGLTVAMLDAEKSALRKDAIARVLDYLETMEPEEADDLLLHTGKLLAQRMPEEERHALWDLPSEHSIRSHKSFSTARRTEIASAIVDGMDLVQEHGSLGALFKLVDRSDRTRRGMDNSRELLEMAHLERPHMLPRNTHGAMKTDRKSIYAAANMLPRNTHGVMKTATAPVYVPDIEWKPSLSLFENTGAEHLEVARSVVQRCEATWDRHGEKSAPVQWSNRFIPEALQIGNVDSAEPWQWIGGGNSRGRWSNASEKVETSDDIATVLFGGSSLNVPTQHVQTVVNLADKARVALLNGEIMPDGRLLLPFGVDEHFGTLIRDSHELSGRTNQKALALVDAIMTPVTAQVVRKVVEQKLQPQIDIEVLSNAEKQADIVRSEALAAVAPRLPQHNLSSDQVVGERAYGLLSPQAKATVDDILTSAKTVKHGTRDVLEISFPAARKMAKTLADEGLSIRDLDSDALFANMTRITRMRLHNALRDQVPKYVLNEVRANGWSTVSHGADLDRDTRRAAYKTHDELMEMIKPLQAPDAPRSPGVSRSENGQNEPSRPEPVTAGQVPGQVL